MPAALLLLLYDVTRTEELGESLLPSPAGPLAYDSMTHCTPDKLLSDILTPFRKQIWQCNVVKINAHGRELDRLSYPT